MNLYSYIIAKDYGLAPNPFWGRMTLTVCKPGIRKHAEVGDWIIGTGARGLNRANMEYVNFAGKLVFAMKVSEIKSMKEYDSLCTASENDFKNKIPKQDKDWRRMVGDCIYKYPIVGSTPLLRQGMHCTKDMEIDLDGENALISDHFYYFGENAIFVQDRFHEFIKDEQGYKKSANSELVLDFSYWLESLGYDRNSINGDPQLKDEISLRFNIDPYNIPVTRIYRAS